MHNELSFFPSPYPDEDFRSIVKRYHKRSGNNNEYISRKNILGTTTNALLPRNIAYLFSKLPKAFKKDKMLFEHTHLPLVFPFVKNDKKKSLLQDIYRIQGSTHSAGKILNGFVSKELRYCPDCKEADVEKYGEPYARRIHQLIGLDFCLEHCVRLQNGNEVNSLNQNIKDIETLKPILEEVKYLLNNEDLKTMNYELSHKYLSFFFKGGYLDKNGSPLTDVFINDLMNNYSTTFKLLGINQKYLSTKNRIWKMINLTHNRPNPFLHILMIRLFTKSVEAFAVNNPPTMASVIPFGSGPWICHNHLCEYYNQSVINNCKRKFRKGGYPTARFECVFCGYTYVRNLKDDVTNYTTVSFGELWERELVSKYRKTKSLKKTAAYCRVKDSVARKYLSKLSPEYQVKKVKGHYSKEQVEEMIATFKKTKSVRKTSVILGVDRRTLKKYLPQELIENTHYYYKNEEKKIKVYKQRILDSLVMLGNPFRTDIKSFVGAETYKYLMKKERYWMEQILPPKNSIKRNWPSLDNTIYKEIVKLVLSLKKDLPKYRITKNRILNSISSPSRSFLDNHPDKLKESIKIIEKSIESQEEYQIRKLDYSINLLKKIKKDVQLEDLKRLPVYRETSTTVEKLITMELDKMNDD